jgi:hypothetical protein
VSEIFRIDQLELRCSQRLGFVLLTGSERFVEFDE